MEIKTLDKTNITKTVKNINNKYDNRNKNSSKRDDEITKKTKTLVMIKIITKALTQ